LAQWGFVIVSIAIYLQIKVQSQPARRQILSTTFWPADDSVRLRASFWVGLDSPSLEQILFEPESISDHKKWKTDVRIETIGVAMPTTCKMDYSDRK